MAGSLMRANLAGALGLCLAVGTLDAQPRPVTNTPPSGARQTVATPQLDVTTQLSQDAVSPGERFSVVVDIVPKPGMHVYAPGQEDYISIAFGVTPQPTLLVKEPQYPGPEDYFFAPLKQHVQVYQKAFRISQELTLDGSPAGRGALKGVETFAIAGSLKFQACDEKICFPPRTVPLKWTVTVKSAGGAR